MNLVFRVCGEIKTYLEENMNVLLVLYRTWGSGALQPLVAKMNITTTNTCKKISLTKTFFPTCFHRRKK